MKVPELKGGQMLTIAYIIGILLAIFVVIKLLQKIGIIKTSAEKKQEKLEVSSLSDLRTDAHFNPDFLTGKTYNPLGQNLALTYANTIHGSIYGTTWFGKLGTNAEKIFSTFSMLKNKMNIAEVAKEYLSEYERDLRADILNNLTDEHIADLNIIINTLPERT